MGKQWTYAEVNAELDKLSESEVRRKLEAGDYHGPKDEAHILAQRWLANKEGDRERLKAATRTDEVEIARSAKDAAWVSAGEAKAANKRSTIALWVSGLAVVIAAVGAFLKL